MGARKAVFLVDALGRVTALYVQDERPLVCGSYFKPKLREWLSRRDPGAWEAELRWTEGTYAPTHVHVVRRVDPGRYADHQCREHPAFAEALLEWATCLRIKPWSVADAMDDSEARRRTTASATNLLRRQLMKDYRAQVALAEQVASLHATCRRNPGLFLSKGTAMVVMEMAVGIVSAKAGRSLRGANFKTAARHLLKAAVSTGLTNLNRVESARLVEICGA